MYNGETIINLDSSSTLDTHVQLSEVKHNLHIQNDETEDDLFITGLIESASTSAQKYCDHYFASTELDFLGYNFKESTYKMRISPFQSLENFEVSDNNTDWTDITSSVFVEKRDSSFILHFEEEVDSTYIRFTVKVGYATDKLEADARAAIIVKASDLFDTERSSYIQKLTNNRTFETLLGAYVNTRWLS